VVAITFLFLDQLLVGFRTVLDVGYGIFGLSVPRKGLLCMASVAVASRIKLAALDKGMQVVCASIY
jgi:hypothetical protein